MPFGSSWAAPAIVPVAGSTKRVPFALTSRAQTRASIDAVKQEIAHEGAAYETARGVYAVTDVKLYPFCQSLRRFSRVSPNELSALRSRVIEQLTTLEQSDVEWKDFYAGRREAFQTRAPSREAGDTHYRELVERASKLDANNQLYATEAVMDYDPSKDLDKIKARLLAINSADDEINPTELGVVEPAIKSIKDARFVLIPASDKTNGHFTYFLAVLWKQHLVEFMNELPPVR